MIRFLIVALAITLSALAQTPDSTKLEPKHLEKAKYPKDAEKNGISGTVAVSFTVDEKGDVADAEAISGEPALQPAALEAIRKSTFKPFIRNGQPAQVKSQMKFVFGELPTDACYTEEFKRALAGDPALFVRQGVSEGRLVHRVNPEYPSIARQTRKQGPVIICATIGTDGLIKQANVYLGDPMLAPAALDAVKQWRYQPYILDGKPIEVATQITINFTLAPQ